METKRSYGSHSHTGRIIKSLLLFNPIRFSNVVEGYFFLTAKISQHIQARFRGYRIRKRYLEATKTAQYSDIDLEEDEFNFDEEVDLNMFDMDEAALESSWAPVNTPQTTRSQREELLPQQKVEVSDPVSIVCRPDDQRMLTL